MFDGLICSVLASRADKNLAEGQMGLVDAIKSGFGNYVGFQGRAARSEYWFWSLFVFVVLFALIIADIKLFGKAGPPVLPLAGMLALFLPGLALIVRRLHDTDRSGWLFLLVMIPLIGPIILLVWFCTRGTAGPNRFGSDPLGGA
jgi:uncharacterized membrane protein YhaH (DUF805 family)